MLTSATLGVDFDCPAEIHLTVSAAHSRCPAVMVRISAVISTVGRSQHSAAVCWAAGDRSGQHDAEPSDPGDPLHSSLSSSSSPSRFYLYYKKRNRNMTILKQADGGEENLKVEQLVIIDMCPPNTHTFIY